jgi:hypothetical protein
MTLADGDEKDAPRPARPRRRAPDTPAERPSARARANPESGLLPELLRRGLTLGFTGFFLTEEALRRALGDSMPRDWIEFMVEQSERTRAEMLDRLSREFGRVIQAFDPVEILRRLLDGQTLEVSARIRLANDGRPRRGDKRETAPEDENE